MQQASRYESGRPVGRLSAGRVVARVFGVLLTIVVALALTVVGVCFLLLRGPSGNARDLVVTTMLESDTLSALPKVFLTDPQIQDILARVAMAPIDPSELDPSLIDTSEALNPDGIEIYEVERPTFSGRVLVVSDPSRVRVATTKPFGDEGAKLTQIVAESTAVGGVNGGLVDGGRGKGGYPSGAVVSRGEIIWLDTSKSGLFLVGLTEDNILRFEDIRGMTDHQVEKLVEDKRIRDGVCMSEETAELTMSFCPLIVNGVSRETDGAGSGENARTVIGQRADGAILLFVCDGSILSGRAGATASDITSIMLEYGAVNAANLCGGSMSGMVYGDITLDPLELVTFGAADEARIPTAFVVDSR